MLVGEKGPSQRSNISFLLQDANDFSRLKMSRSIGSDGMAEEEYNFNSEVALEAQVSGCIDTT